MPTADGRAGRLRARRGVTLPFIVLLITVFLGMSAFAIDVSRMLVIRAELQTSADAAAIAGAMQLITTNRASGYDSALAFAQRNLVEKVPPTMGEGDIQAGTYEDGVFTERTWTDPLANAVKVTTHHTGSYYFGPVYNVTSSNVRAEAIAKIGCVSGMTCVRPIAFPYQILLQVLGHTTYDPNYNLTTTDVDQLRAATIANSITLKLGSSDTSIVSGSFFAVREPPLFYAADSTFGDPWQGADDYRAALMSACPDLPYLVSMGDWLQGESGNKVGPTRAGIQSQCGGPVCNPALQFDIPIWDSAYKKFPGTTDFRVKYIGSFMVTGFNSGAITGYFNALLGSGSWKDIPCPIQRPALVH